MHLAALPEDGVPGALTALCGVLLPPEDIEQVSVGEGMPCTLCAVSHVSVVLPPGDTVPEVGAAPPGVDAGPSEAAAVYQGWGWPVTLRRDQVWLALGSDAAPAAF